MSDATDGADELPVLKVSTLKQLWDAADRIASDAEPVTDSKKALRDTVKGHHINSWVWNAAEKLRALPPETARARLEQLNMICDAMGITTQTDLVFDTDLRRDAA